LYRGNLLNTSNNKIRNDINNTSTITITITIYNIVTSIVLYHFALIETHASINFNVLLLIKREQRKNIMPQEKGF